MYYVIKSPMGRILKVSFLNQYSKDAILPEPPVGKTWMFRSGTWGSSVSLVPENYRINQQIHIPEYMKGLMDAPEVSEVILPDDQKTFGVLPPIPKTYHYVLYESPQGVRAMIGSVSQLPIIIARLGLKRMEKELKIKKGLDLIKI